MAGGKINARQKMINMMYLVLTALLALNVSKEILDAFVVINMGLLQQKESLEHKNKAVLADFNSQRIIDSKNVRLQFLNEQAIYITGIANELTDEIEKMKVDLVVKVDGADQIKATDIVKNPMKVDRKDDYDGPTNFFGTDKPPGTIGKAHDLKLKINAFREKCMAIVDKVLADPLYVSTRKTIRAEVDQKLAILLTKDPTDNREYPTWEMQYFYHLPLSAALTELTKWQNFVEGAEGDVLNFLWTEISRNAYKFDKIKVAVIPKSCFITSGSNFEADVFLAAYSTNGSNLPTIVYGSSVDTSTMKVNGGITLAADKFVNGVGKVSFPVSGLGEKTFAGTLQMKDPSGNVRTLPFSTTYNVAPASASIAPTNLSVVYYGVDNPFSISVPGVAPNNIVVHAVGANVLGSNGNYTINPNSTSGNITINVSARMQDGTTQQMGSRQFRIKRVPKPEIKWNGLETGSTIKKNRAVVSPIVADMSGFLFPVASSVISVKGYYKGSSDGFDVNFDKNIFPQDLRDRIIKSPGTGKLFLQILVSIPGGTTKIDVSYTLIN